MQKHFSNRRRQVRDLEEIGRIRLSENFFLRDFLHSEIAAVFGVTNLPADLSLAVASGRQLCETLLEPLHRSFGKVCIRSGYRSEELNSLGHRLRLGCASNQRNFAGHIWDRRDQAGQMGATACIIIPGFADWLGRGGDWRAMAAWIDANLPYSSLCFFNRLGAFNIQWKEKPERRIFSWKEPRGNHDPKIISKFQSEGRKLQSLCGLSKSTWVLPRHNF